MKVLSDLSQELFHPVGRYGGVLVGGEIVRRRQRPPLVIPHRLVDLGPDDHAALLRQALDDVVALAGLQGDAAVEGVLLVGEERLAAVLASVHNGHWLSSLRI
jgi:hypothetical protein